VVKLDSFPFTRYGTMLMTGVTGVPARHLWKMTDTITRTEHATFEMLVVVRAPYG
jgi:hypothetical protein